MKRILALGLSTLLAVPLVSTTVIWAEDSNSGALTPGSSDSSQTENATPTNTTNSDTTNQSPSGEDTQGMQTRIEQRKTELKINLTALEKTNIQTKCKAAQGVVSSVKGRLQGIETSRSEVYTNLINRLTDLSTKLKNKGFDTTALDAAIATLKTKITTFTTDLATYQQDVSDLAGMDCKADPNGFKASLQAARTALTTVTTDAQAIKSFVNDTIKPELQKIHDALENNKTEENQ